MSIEIRHAQESERNRFLAMWVELLLDLQKKGGDTATSEKSIKTYDLLLGALLE